MTRRTRSETFGDRWYVPAREHADVVESVDPDARRGADNLRRAREAYEEAKQGDNEE